MRIHPYFNFDDYKAEEAFKSYQKIFGGNIELVRYTELDMEMPEGQDPVAYIQLDSDAIVIQGGDTLEGQELGPIGNQLSVLITVPNLALMHKYIADFMAMNAREIVPFFEHPTIGGFAAVRDEYGVLWSFMHQGDLPISTPFFSAEATQAKEVVAFYENALGIKAEITTIGEFNPDDVERKDQIAMAKFNMNNKPILIVSDIIPGKEPREMGKASSLSLFLGGVEEGKRITQALGKGGSIKSDMIPAEWAKGFSDLHDKYGINWLINAQMHLLKTNNIP